MPSTPGGVVIGTISPSPTGVVTTRNEGALKTTGNLEALINSVKEVAVEPSRQPKFLGQSGGITLAKLVMAAIRPGALSSTSLQKDSLRASPTPPSVLAAASSLPPRHVADHLVDVYFQYRTPHLPIIDRIHVDQSVNAAYNTAEFGDLEDTTTEKHIFITYMILSIALCDLQNPFGSGRPLESEGCFQSALMWADHVIAYSQSDIETLRCILLLAQYVALYPSQGSLWHLAGIAMRMSIDIGLHWEGDEDRIHMDPGELHDRRQLWYTTYQFDRSLCITLGRPFGITDESTRVQLPNPWIPSSGSVNSDFNDWDIHVQRAHNHLFTLSQLESEIVHVQYSQSWSAKMAYPRANYTTWIKDMQPRLREWYSAIPELSKAHTASIFASQAYWDILYNSTVLRLYRPNSMISHVSIGDLSISYDASCNLIAGLKRLQRDGKVEVLWKAVHQLFTAGLNIIYCLWYSKEIRDQHAISKCISTLQSCNSTLSAMSETFHGAAGCRDVFDSLSSATTEWLITSDTQKSTKNSREFENQVEDLLRHLQPSQRTLGAPYESNANKMSNMLSSESFVFSEMLNLAAQQQDLRDVEYDQLLDD